MQTLCAQQLGDYRNDDDPGSIRDAVHPVRIPLAATRRPGPHAPAAALSDTEVRLRLGTALANLS